MRPALQNPFYYLDNFQQVLAWIGERHGDLLDDRERAFLDEFASLPQSSRALLVRMVMRKGSLFRAGKLRYAEIGCPLQAATALLAQGWIDSNPQLSLTQLFALLNKNEIVEVFGLSAAAGRRKAELLEELRAEHVAIQPWSAWCLALDETAFELRIDALCERLRLMFFGNSHQDWSEFVLADLGIFRYEQVAFSPQSRAFSSRQEVDSYLQLQRCRERFEAGEPIEELLALIPQAPYANPWLENRRGKLLLRIGQQCERNGELAQALRLHAANHYPGARARAIRVLEHCAQPEAALELALTAQASPEGEHEAQQLQRILPRLRRALGQSSSRRTTATAGVQRIDLALPRPPGVRVEQAVRAHLADSDAPVHYVENALLNSLLGLLCWDAIFAPLPGAFFHPFHAGPADLARADFYSRRAELFQDCLSELEAGTHKTRIRRVFREKYGIQSQFVSWGLLDEALLEQALDCLPAAHLDACFRRILADVPNHRSGLPDLIQFWPAERRYRMIEVKGPGDRLQDNQLRWLDYACQHNLPVAVCHVQWIDATP